VGWTGDLCGDVFAEPTSSAIELHVAPEKVPNLQMILYGVPPLSEQTFSTWADVTAAHTVDFYIANPQYGISDIVTSFEFVSQDPPLLLRRHLQVEQVTLTYEQTISYMKEPSSTLTTLDVVTLPFSSVESRNEYTEKLRETGIATFENILGVSSVDQAGEGRVADDWMSSSSEASLCFLSTLNVAIEVLFF
jgi:hypothetical protein